MQQIMWAYSYFISYWAMGDDSHTGYGNTEYNTDRPVTGFARIDEMQTRIKELNPQFKQVIILNWRPFEEI